jgi:hypothetical protein
MNKRHFTVVKMVLKVSEKHGWRLMKNVSYRGPQLSLSLEM